MNTLTVDFFLGSNSQNGFVSHFEQLQDPMNDLHTYIIKGGPGSGKSTLMRRVADEFACCGELAERIHCSSDPHSLDGVILHGKKAALVDGTPPHVLEPRYPAAAASIVSLYDAFDAVKIKACREDIIETAAVNSAFHKRFCELLKCMNLLLDGNAALIAPYIDSQKMERTISNIAKKEFKKSLNRPGKCHVRMLSAFTPDGLCTYQNTVNTLCKRVYLLQDEYQVCSHELMSKVSRYAMEQGYDCYLCYSPFHAEGKIDHVLIPELSLGFVTQSRFIQMDRINPAKVMNATRFYDKIILKQKKQRLNFCKKTARELIIEAVETLHKAKQTHDILEEYYIRHIDFEEIDAVTQKLIEEIEQS